MADPLTRELLVERQRIFDLSIDLICTADAEGRFRAVSASAGKILGYTPAELVGRRFLELVHPDDIRRTLEAHQAIVGGASVVEFENRYFRKDGSIVDLSWSASLSSEAGLTYAVGRDVTNRKRSELLQAAQHELLQMIAGGVGLEEILQRLCLVMEELDPESKCSVALFDPQGQRISSVVAPSLPASYAAGLEGASINAPANTCTAALRSGQTVVSPDISTDSHYWREHRTLALAHGLRASWSTPVLGAHGQVIAALAVYRTMPKSPSHTELSLAQAAANLVSVAIEHARANTQLVDSLTRLELAQNIACLGYWERDFLTDQLHVYGETNAILGFGVDEPIDWPTFLDMILEEDRPTALAAYGQPEGGDHRAPLQVRIRRRDGAVRHIYAQRRAIHDNNGKLIRVIGTLQDVTDRYDADMERQQYLTQLAFLAAAARKVNSVLTIEELLQVITQIARDLVNAHLAVGSVTGDTTLYSRSLSAKYATLEPQEDSELWRGFSLPSAPLRPIRLPRSAGEGSELDARSTLAASGILSVSLSTPDGRSIGEIRVADKRDGDFTQNDERVLVQLADLAAVGVENARLYGDLEARVRQRTQELEQSNRELEAFSYSVSHDLRGPLRAIAGFTGLLRERHYETIDADSRRYIDRVLAGTERMSNLIDDLLELGRVTRVEIKRELVDVSALAHAVIAQIREHAPQRQASITIEPEQKVHGDLRLMEIALENLFDNAWKFTAGRAVTQIHFGVTRDARGERTFFVRDNGVGFDSRYAANLFGVFQRLHATSEFPGTGVGLATVQRIVHRHGGRIWARADVDRGATFFFTIAKG